MADLNQALQECRRGSHIRDDMNMQPEWKIYFVPDAGQEKIKDPAARKGSYFYINPKTGPAYEVRFSPAMKASPCWRVVP